MSKIGQIQSNAVRVDQPWDAALDLPGAEQYLREHPLERAERYDPKLAENIIEARELAVAAARPERMDHQERFEGSENEAMRFVRIMHPHTVLAHLRRAGVDARSEPQEVLEWGYNEQGKPAQIRVASAGSTCRLWLNPGSRVGLVGVNARVRDAATGRYVPKTLTSLQYPYGPEWSLMHFNAKGVATAERFRGWRTALLKLILADVLTESEVERAFGPVKLHTPSLEWRRLLFEHRSRGLGMIA